MTAPAFKHFTGGNMLKFGFILILSAGLYSSSFANTSSSEDFQHFTTLPCVIDCDGKPDINLDEIGRLAAAATGATGSTGSTGTTGTTGATTTVAVKPATTPTPAPTTDTNNANDSGVYGTVVSSSGSSTSSPTQTSPGTINPASMFNGNAAVIIGQLTTIGTKVWDFVVNNKPTATYDSLKASVVPSGIKDWRELSGWSMPVKKVYHIKFYSKITGKVAGGFDYRIVYQYGGNYQGKGKYIGQISVNADKITLRTDRGLNIRTELLPPLNMGTVEDPVAGVQLLVNFNTNTTLGYLQGSKQYYLSGNGEIVDLSDE